MYCHETGVKTAMTGELLARRGKIHDASSKSKL
jgi:hypothetical protein